MRPDNISRLTAPPSFAPGSRRLDHCTGCGACVPACPARALSLESERPGGLGRKLVAIESSRCSGCGACLATCPRQALSMEYGNALR